MPLREREGGNQKGKPGDLLEASLRQSRVKACFGCKNLGMQKIAFLCAWGLFFCLHAMANRVRLDSVVYRGGTSFGLSLAWDNSWRNQNHDAVWLFAKGLTDYGRWQHLRISRLVPQSDSISAKIPSDRTGAMLAPSVFGNFHIPPTRLEIEFENFVPEEHYQIQFFAIEMVWVNEGSFFVGDSLSQSTLCQPNSTRPIFISSEAPLSISSKSAKTPYQVKAGYPKGYAGFYVMKHEISQGMYAAFLNTLPAEALLRHTQNLNFGSATMVAEGLDNFRNTIIRQPDASFRATAPDRACNFLSWDDVVAILDWAALRPMSELEFEKAARGTQPPLPKGYPWGTALLINADTPLFDGTPDETSAETATSSAGLANSGGTFDQSFLQGPLRCGFGANQSSDILQAGASPWGILELSGNVWELCVGVWADFDGSHGDGDPTTAPSWPQAQGAGHRGGGWNSLVKNDLNYEYRDLAVSDRFYMNLPPTLRRNTTGGRGVRSGF